jgi:hypothetical protein
MAVKRSITLGSGTIGQCYKTFYGFIDATTSVTCGLYYKHTMIMNNDSSIVNKFEASFTEDARVIIYNHHMFVIQVTESKY